MAARDHVTIYTTKFDIFNADIQNLKFPKYSRLPFTTCKSLFRNFVNAWLNFKTCCCVKSCYRLYNHFPGICHRISFFHIVLGLISWNNTILSGKRTWQPFRVWLNSNSNVVLLEIHVTGKRCHSSRFMHIHSATVALSRRSLPKQKKTWPECGSKYASLSRHLRDVHGQRGRPREAPLHFEEKLALRWQVEVPHTGLLFHQGACPVG